MSSWVIVSTLARRVVHSLLLVSGPDKEQNQLTILWKKKDRRRALRKRHIRKYGCICVYKRGGRCRKKTAVSIVYVYKYLKIRKECFFFSLKLLNIIATTTVFILVIFLLFWKSRDKLKTRGKKEKQDIHVNRKHFQAGLPVSWLPSSSLSGELMNGTFPSVANALCVGPFVSRWGHIEVKWVQLETLK